MFSYKVVEKIIQYRTILNFIKFNTKDFRSTYKNKQCSLYKYEHWHYKRKS